MAGRLSPDTRPRRYGPRKDKRHHISQQIDFNGLCKAVPYVDGQQVVENVALREEEMGQNLPAA